MSAVDAPGYGTLQRGLSVLLVLQREGRMRVVDLVDRLGLPTSTVYRYLAVLREDGFVVDLDGYVMAGPRLAEPDDEGAHLVGVARPVLSRMAARTGCSAVLAVRVRAAALCLDVAMAHPRHRVAFRRGQARSLHAGASALPLLAYAPAAVQREVLGSPQRRFTAATPDSGSVRAQLDQVLSDGWVVTRGQLTPGMAAVGVPVLTGGRCLCALSLLADSGSLPDADVPGLVTTLQEGAAELVARLPRDHGWENEDV